LKKAEEFWLYWLLVALLISIAWGFRIFSFMF